jgi:hypothetical protein
MPSESSALRSWIAEVSTHLAHLSKPQAVVLALWSFGMVLAQSCGLTSVAAVLEGYDVLWVNCCGSIP